MGHSEPNRMEQCRTTKPATIRQECRRHLEEAKDYQPKIYISVSGLYLYKSELIISDEPFKSPRTKQFEVNKIMKLKSGGDRNAGAMVL